ncbi:MAG TPA: hypothetical protein GXZ90_11185, partial [Clostridiales bacterium]|nr:hypothetical protein [Clostridiales bacterium]
MKALSYLILKSLKNKVLELMKKPSLLVLYLFVFFVIIIMFVFSAFIKVDTTKIGDERIIYLIIVSVVFLSVITNVLAGLKSGSTLFDMADVNQVFVAPISSTTVLFYGIIKQAGKVLLSSLFVFYQSVNLKTSFNFGMKEIFTLLLIMILISFSAQFISMFIYIYSNGNEKRKELIKLISLILGVLFIVYIYFNIN